MRAHLAAVVAHKNHVEILVIIGEIGGCLFGRCVPVARNILAKIVDEEFGFPRSAFEEILEFRSFADPRYARKRNGCPARKGRGGLLSHSRLCRAQQHTPEMKNPTTGPHAVQCLYIAEENRSEEHTSELQSRGQLVCRLL